MPVMQYTAGDVMDSAAAFLNDRRKSIFSYEVQLPYLQSAQEELELELHSEGIQVVDSVCDEIVILAGATEINVPPCNLFLPVRIQERPSGSTNPEDYVDLVHSRFNPNSKQESTLRYWDFRGNKIRFIGATTDRGIRLEYKRMLRSMTDEAIVEEVTRAKNFLAKRTASLCAEFIGRNKQRADSLNLQAYNDLDKLISVYVKNIQGMRVRRKPFRLSQTSLRVRTP